jgi:hypothetical protein
VALQKWNTPYHFAKRGLNLKPQIFTQDTSAREAYKHQETLERTIHFKIGKKLVNLEGISQELNILRQGFFLDGAVQLTLK